LIGRFPALTIGAAWSVGIAATVVLAPAQTWLGAAAIALAIPCLGLVAVLRPAVVGIALVAALLGIGRAGLPPADPGEALRAVSVAGQPATLTGWVADDSRPISGGAEVLVEPGEMLVDGRQARALGNVVVRWKGPEEAGFGDVVEATGRLRLPIDQPGFDRRAYLGQRQAYLELDATDFRVRAPAEGLQGLPRWLRTHYVAALDDALPPPHAAVLLGVVLGIRHGIPARLDRKSVV